MPVDGTQTKPGVTPGAEKAETPIVFTKEQQAHVDKLVRDRETSIKADVGRQKAEADKALKAAQAAQRRIEELQKAQEEAEQEKYRDDPAELKRIRAEQARKKAESEAAEARAQLDEANARLADREAKDKEYAKENTAREIATRLQVDSARLVKLAKFTDGTAEAIEDIAKDLPKLNPNPNPDLRLDSNRSHGGASQSVNDIRTDYIAGRINAVAYAEKLKALGVQP